MDKMINKAIDSERIAIDMIATGMIEETSIDERYKMKKEQLDKAVDILATAKKIDYEKAYKRGKRRGIIVGAIGIIGTIAAGILAIKYGWNHEKNRYSDGFAEFPEKRVYDKNGNVRSKVKLDEKMMIDLKQDIDICFGIIKEEEND